MTGSSPTGLEERRGSSAAPRMISAPWRNKQAHNFFMHGHLTVVTPGSRTGYQFDNGEVVEIENEPGLLTLIGRTGVMHYTTPNPSDQPRISIAFDLCRAPHMNNDTLNRHTFIPLL